MFLENVTLSLAYKEARAHQESAGIISGVALSAGRVSAHASTEPRRSRHSHVWPHTGSDTQALGQGWLGAPEGTVSSSCASSVRQQAQAASCQLSTSKLYDA